MASSSRNEVGIERRLPDAIIAQAQAIATETSNHDMAGRGPVGTQPSVAGGPETQLASRHTASQRVSESWDTDNIQSPGTNAPPPPYEGSYNSVTFSQDGLDTNADVASDGRVNIRFDQKTNRLSTLLVPALRSQLKLQRTEEPSSLPPGYVPPSLGGVPGQGTPPPPFNVVIHVVGSRGDVQPFVALGKVLKKTYQHRVRLATHPVFRTFVEENGLEFFSIGGDPAELMAFMVKNPGLMPGKDALRSGDVGKRRKGMYEIIRGCWRSCFEAGDGTGIAISDEQPAEGFSRSPRPFVADAIIANPPSFAHVHIAEKLGVPLHLMFTMPWSPTQAFPHPLANIQSSNADASITNFVSYAIVEMMTWQGLGDIINRFRENVLGLEPIDLIRAPVLVSRLKIPYTYCWSPALIPKPQDWGHHISISGFYFLSLAQAYHPADDLWDFLQSGPPPVYIGFGSIVLDNPSSMTRLIFEAVRKSGQRALVSKGWGGVGADELGIPDGVFMLGNVPHDWLFKHVSCVVHHGGAGTTAAGIALSKPTVVVPFFGDQPFWGAMIAKAGAGPEPIHHKQLTADNLADAIRMALRPETLQRAQELGSMIASEKGSDVGAKSFHDALEIDSLRCSLAPSRTALWQVKKTDIRLSGLAAAILGKEGLLDFDQLRLYRYKEYDGEDGPLEPISGAASALMGTISGLMMGVADVPVDIFKAIPRKASKSGKRDADDGSAHAEAREESEPGSTLEVSLNGVTHRTGSDPPSTSVSAHKSSERESPFQNRLSQSSRESQSPERTSKNHQGVTLGDAIGAGKGFGRVVDAGIKSPMDFTLSLAKGFHNAPRLYGDATVRPHEPITGFQSGLKAAGKEFGFGFYDGISGLFTQPLEGAKKEGFAGLAKGFGKGIGGLMLKPAAAVWGLPGYTFKGLYKEMVKRFGYSVQNYIIAARIAQGYEDLDSSSAEERLDIVKRWGAACTDSSKNLKGWETGESNQTDKSSSPSSTLHQETKSTGPLLGQAGDEAFDEAIKESVVATSTGNAEEDQWIARAIKASIAELRQAAREGQGDKALQNAITASIEEANRARLGDHSHHSGHQSNKSASDKDLHLTVQRNLRVQEDSSERHSDNPDIDTDDDENVKQAIEHSKHEYHAEQASNSELAKAIAESLEGSAEYQKERRKGEEEERVVMEYVKRQSMLEEHHRETAGK